MIHLILLVFAFVMFTMAGFLLPSPPNWPHRLVAWGLALLTLAELFTSANIIK